jgi:predicted patatin/cPLA2 family phospholipase
MRIQSISTKTRRAALSSRGLRMQAAAGDARLRSGSSAIRDARPGGYRDPGVAMLTGVTGGVLRRAVAARARSRPEALGSVLPGLPLASLTGLDDPVLRVMVERVLVGSQPGARTDGARVALAIEGGGMAGAVSGGMCAALEALGLVTSFDAVYGTSSGAINASYTAAGQARSHNGLYAVAAQMGLVDPRRLVRRQSPIRTDEVVDSLFRAHPHAVRVLDDTPQLRLVATRVQDKSLQVLGRFNSLDELRAAIWASCAIPVRSDDVVRIGDVAYVDGGLTEPMPYRVALRDGATHVLVLRCRPVRHRQSELRGPRRKVVERLFRDAPEPVVELVGEYAARYNAQACEIASGGLADRVTQLAPDTSAGLISPLERSPHRLRNAVALGAAVVYSAVGASSVGLLAAPRYSPRSAIAGAA